MKTKTITKEFWVSDDLICDIQNNIDINCFYNFHTRKSERRQNLVKVHFEVPEKQVTISESEFEKLFEKDIHTVSMMGGTRCIDKQVLKQKLFGNN